MDTLFTLLVNAGNGPVIRDGVDAATRPASRRVPLPRRAEPGPARAARAPLRKRPWTAVTTRRHSPLELDDIQSGALHERPSPYVGTYLLLRIDDRAAGRELVRRLLPLVDAGAAVGRARRRRLADRRLHLPGLKALGVPQASLDSFAPEFRQGMAARAAELGDVGDEQPGALGEAARHPGRPRRPGRARPPTRPASRRVAERARRAHEELPGVEVIWRQDCYQLPTGRTSFGFKDGIGQPAVEGSGRPRHEPAASRRSRRASSSSATRTRPASCRRCRRRTCSAATAPTSSSASCTRGWRPTGSTCATRAASREEEALLGAKMVGPLAERRAARARARAGRPGARRRPPAQQRLPATATTCAASSARPAPTRGGPTRGTRSTTRGSVDVRLHRMIRRGTSYGPMLPEGVLEDDGVDRGIIFVFAGAHLKRQFEFVKTQWLNDGIFIGAPAEKDPLVGPHDGSGTFTIPQQPIRRRLQRPAAVRRHPRRRVLLRAGPARAALAGRADHVTGSTTEGDGMTDHDRHRPLEGAGLRAPGRRRGRARASRCSSTTSPTAASR